MKNMMLPLLLAASTTAFADEGFAIRGAGAVSCGKFLEAQDRPSTKNIFIGWTQGFLSGMNLVDSDNGKKMLQLPDAESMNLYISNYCTQNPLESPALGAIVLYRELRDRDQRAAP